MTKTPSAVTACVAIVLFCALAVRPAGAAEGDCRDLEVGYDIAKRDITSIQRNAILFTAAAKGCVPLSRRLLADGASLEARDRAGAMALALAARGGNVALVEMFLAAGARIDARDLKGATALYGAAESDRPSTVALLLGNGADPNLTGASGVSPSPPPPTRAMTA